MNKCIVMRLRIPWFPGRGLTRLTLAVLVILAVPYVASPATFTVNRTTDFEDAIPGDGFCETAPGNGLCTLRAAIQEANALESTDLINIILPMGMYNLTRGGLEINVNLAIAGMGADNTIIDGGICPNGADDPACTADNATGVGGRVFSILNPEGKDPVVLISDMTIQNGAGGLFISQRSILSLSNCVVRKNRGRLSGVQTSGGGAGINNDGLLQIFQCTISDNSLPNIGGGGQASSGGGIYNSASGSIDIDRSTISGNEATRGGGISNGSITNFNGGPLKITNSTISDNRALARGGGIHNFGIMTIAFSTIAGNTAGQRSGNLPVMGEDTAGGGIYNLAEVFASDGFPIPSTIFLGNTILANNRAMSGMGHDCFNKDPGRFTSFRSNLISDIHDYEMCNIEDVGLGRDTLFDLIGCLTESECPLDPGLAGCPSVSRVSCIMDPIMPCCLFDQDRQSCCSVANNGGPTKTLALLPDSPAIDQGTGVTSAEFFDCPETDQRGFNRPVDDNGNATAACDIGAFEFGAIPPEISLQDGVSPTAAYAGTQDTYISEDQPTAKFCILPTLRVDGDDPPGTGRDLNALLKWDLSAIPAGSEVKSATITINVTNPTGGTYELYRISSPWEECQVTWNTRPSRGMTVRGTVGPASTGTHTITLNNDGVALVQSWVDESTPNYGIMMAASDVPDGLAFDSSEASPASNRPRLTITFE